MNRKQKQNLFLASALIVLCLLIVFVAVLENHIWSGSFDINNINKGTSSGTLFVELLNEDAVLVQDAILQYLALDILNSSNLYKTPASFADNQERLDAQVPVVLKMQTKDVTALYYKVELSENSIFNNAEIKFVEASSGICNLTHLYANKEYFYRITAYTESGTLSTLGSFKTADTPRLLSIDGISNVRDIGNWKTDSGKRIKQGLLIRGTELDGAIESGYRLTNQGLVDMLMQYGIKTDMDLRSSNLASSKDALGPQVTHKYYDIVGYEAIFTDYGKERIKDLFTDLANPGMYPIYMHCTYGEDRTGTICYLLEALLGVSRGDCLKEFGLSDLREDQIDDIISVESQLRKFEGSTLKECTESYLLSCGITKSQIESIRNIFLGD